MRSNATCAILLVLHLASAVSAQEATPTFRLDVKAGFGGLHKGYCWTPLRVSIKNPSGYKGRVAVRVDTESARCPWANHGQVLRRFCREIELRGEPEVNTIIPFRPTMVNRCWMYLVRLDGLAPTAPPPSAGSRACQTGQCPLHTPVPLDVDRILTTKREDTLIHGCSIGDLAFALVGQTRDLETILTTKGLLEEEDDAEIRTATADYSELVDNPTLYECLDCVVFGGAGDNRVSEAQRDALRRWVVSGGTVVLTRACIESKDGPALMEGLCGASVAGSPVRTDCSDAWSFLGVPVPGIEPLEILPVRVPDDAFKVECAGRAALAVVTRGLGSVILVLFDPSDIRTPAGRNRQAREQVWGRILEPVKTVWRWTSPSGAEYVVVPERATLKDLAAPYVGFVILAAVIVGPVCIVLVRSRRRRIHVIWILPLMSCLLCIVSFAWGALARGIDPHLEILTLLSGRANQALGLSHQYVGLLGGSVGDYVLGGIPGDCSVKESFEGAWGEGQWVGVFPPMVRSGGTTQLEQLRVNAWSMRFFEVWRCADMPLLSGSLRYEEGKLVGWVRNESQLPIDKAFLLFKWNRKPLPHLGPGERAEVELSLEQHPREVRDSNEIPLPISLPHWPDIPFPRMARASLGARSRLIACPEPAIVSFHTDGDAVHARPELRDRECSGTHAAVVVWRLPIEPLEKGLVGFPAELSVARDPDSLNVLYYVWCRRRKQTMEFLFPHTAERLDQPAVTAEIRLSKKDMPSMLRDDHIRFALYDWHARDWGEARTLKLTGTEIRNASNFVRDLDNRVRMQIWLEGPRAERYGHVMIDRLELSIAGASQ